MYAESLVKKKPKDIQQAFQLRMPYLYIATCLVGVQEKQIPFSVNLKYFEVADSTEEFNLRRKCERRFLFLHSWYPYIMVFIECMVITYLCSSADTSGNS